MRGLAGISRTDAARRRCCYILFARKTYIYLCSMYTVHVYVSYTRTSLRRVQLFFSSLYTLLLKAFSARVFVAFRDAACVQV